jgi:polyisoprenoid-binding protein YceI
MVLIISVFTLLSTFVLIPAHQESLQYKIDPGHTSITTSVNRFSVVDVVGRFTDVNGAFYVTGNGIENVEIRINTASYTANNSDGENAVKSPAFLNVAQFPEILFKATEIKLAGKNLFANG